MVYSLKILKNIEKDIFITNANKYLRKNKNYLNEKLKNFYKLLVDKYKNDANIIFDKKHFCVINYILLSFQEPWNLNELRIYSIFFIVYSYCVTDYNFNSCNISKYINISDSEFQKETIKLTLLLSKKLHFITTNSVMFYTWQKHWEYILKNNNLNKISLKEII